jgi:phosphotransferase system enzyme I (PtsI)
LLYPLISDVGDFRLFKDLTARAKRMLKEKGMKFNPNIKEGVMIETPSSAVLSDAILKEADFANIGSNDLLQYTLAAARGNPVAEKRYHVVHPSIVYLMERIVRAGAKHKKEICLCGEISSFEEYYPLFLGLGIRSFSVSASKFYDIKCRLLHEEKSDAGVVDRFYRLDTKKAMDKFFEH